MVEPVSEPVRGLLRRARDACESLQEAADSLCADLEALEGALGVREARGRFDVSQLERPSSRTAWVAVAIGGEEPEYAETDAALERFLRELRSSDVDDEFYKVDRVLEGIRYWARHPRGVTSLLDMAYEVLGGDPTRVSDAYFRVIDIYPEAFQSVVEERIKVLMESGHLWRLWAEYGSTAADTVPLGHFRCLDMETAVSVGRGRLLLRRPDLATASFVVHAESTRRKVSEREMQGG